jgi:hypothetical protein
VLKNLSSFSDLTRKRSRTNIHNPPLLPLPQPERYSVKDRDAVVRPKEGARSMEWDGYLLYVRNFPRSQMPASGVHLCVKDANHNCTRPEEEETLFIYEHA